MLNLSSSTPSNLLSTVKESPSTQTSLNPNSSPSVTTCKHARASAIAEDDTFSHGEAHTAITMPSMFLAIILEHDLLDLATMRHSRYLLRCHSLLSNPYYVPTILGHSRYSAKCTKGKNSALHSENHHLGNI
ncbi:hypothetical protein EPI10_031033 [Gossypium australe]|uniref:Uncharacterized protein n=1 Tax=Gossypium australe TaxID=47621 RepID=A0A5B6X284_9ROSI|nr:hypothetical protein EPI10_031033 [Gossypium australe]